MVTMVFNTQVATNIASIIPAWSGTVTAIIIASKDDSVVGPNSYKKSIYWMDSLAMFS